jgi:hypothetical protein
LLLDFEKRKQDLEKIYQLESKLDSEFKIYTEKKNRLDQEIAKVSNLEMIEHAKLMKRVKMTLYLQY